MQIEKVPGSCWVKYWNSVSKKKLQLKFRLIFFHMPTPFCTVEASQQAEREMLQKFAFCWNIWTRMKVSSTGITRAWSSTDIAYTMCSLNINLGHVHSGIRFRSVFGVINLWQRNTHLYSELAYFYLMYINFNTTITIVREAPEAISLLGLP